MRHIANYGIRESQVKIVITFFVARKMGSVEPKSTLQEALFKAQEMTQDEMEIPSCRAEVFQPTKHTNHAKMKSRRVDRSV